MKTPMSSDTKLTKDEECESVDSTKYQGTMHLGLWYPKGTGIETVVYSDSDHAGDYVDRKSTSGIYTFVRCCLTSWFSKKQTALAISTTEAEYVSTGKACQQALWMKQALIDYGVRLDDVPIMCDNKGAIDLSKTRHTLDISSNKETALKLSFSLLGEMTLEDELRSIHEGRHVSPESTKYDNIQTIFQTVNLPKIYELHEGICPRFLLEFYSSIEITRDNDLNISLTFWALKRSFKFSLESFASILSIPCKGECSYSEESTLESLIINQESNTPYRTHILTPNEIIQSIITTRKNIFPNKILKEELRHDMRSWNEIIQDNAFGTHNDSNFLLASSCHMMYCIITSTPFNFAYFLTKRAEKIKNQPNPPIPYGIILNRLYDHLIKTNPHLRKSKYVSYWPSMKPWVHPSHLQAIIYISSDEASSDDSNDG
ncbi:hypothetical protein Tco_1124794 [Tanacetum coccineum]|uniref:Copia protein n=1 Tax=Tanacetum coccineum TaxID=301880 RepID=A0ABQ5J795_9ASTR